jgi:hypothetical protein
MHSVKFTGFLGGKLYHFEGLDLESFFDNAVQNGSAVTVTERIGLDHGKGSVAHGYRGFAPRSYGLYFIPSSPSL